MSSMMSTRIGCRDNSIPAEGDVEVRAGDGEARTGDGDAGTGDGGDDDGPGSKRCKDRNTSSYVSSVVAAAGTTRSRLVNKPR